MRKTYRRTSRHATHKRRHSRRGGAATVMPLQYYNPGAARPDAPAGGDLLKASPPNMVRPKIGGRRSRNRNRKSKGGFVPSVMGGFIDAASKYIVPIALYAGYKLMTRKRSTRRRR
jgi:hypothetical protein